MNSKTWTVKLTPAELTKAKDLLREHSPIWHEPRVGQSTTVKMSITVRGKPR